MRCTEFLELYSEYRDGLIASSALERSMLRHVATCQTCMRYNARVSRGVTAMRAFSDLEPTAGFRGKLDGRLARAAMVEEEPVLPGPTGLMVGLMVAAALAIVIWGGWGRTNAESGRSFAIERVAPTPPPLPAVFANPRPPFVSFADLSVPAFDPGTHTPGASEGTFFTLTAGTE